jgi:hypothetical protein
MEQIYLVKRLALSGKFTNAQVCSLVCITDSKLQQILESLLRNDREFQRASGLLTG